MANTISSATNLLGQDVFIGGDVDLLALANPADVAALLATGRVSFYTQDDGVEAAYYAGTLGTIVQGVANTGPGEAEVNLQGSAWVADWFSSWWQSAWTNYGLAPTKMNVIVNFDSPTWVTDFNATVVEAQKHGIQV